MIQIQPLKVKRIKREIEPVKLHPSRGRTALSRFLRAGAATSQKPKARTAQ
ncbi:hypothetical protein C8J27_107108 [Rhodobacter aestuarii]|uniref:Uncharacterized protein n=1 Tax=Rhodobacter aestuarii TaxID=453582 RepID=A0A1N7NSH4_9RHOB|nr:hypothetical protein C8J27_107108 [Rhodobacter aestuarii]SIT01267.1 hypothetical protein SAMN05421580_108119 [Rhodobacter aestuarii]SOC12522.1 hypothetical protein SAMN05877809_106107 [Rhodobacter sp. JA431]